MTLRSRSCVIGRGVRDVLDLQRDGVGLEDPDPDRQHTSPSASRSTTMGMLVMGSTISPLIVISICIVVSLPADGVGRRASLPKRRLPCSAVSSRRRRRRPQRLFGPGPLDREPAPTGRSASRVPGRFTTVLPRRPPGHLVRRAAGSSRPRAPRPSSPTRRAMQLGLHGALQFLQRDDPPRLLRFGTSSGMRLSGERVRPRRVLEREHAAEADRAQPATASRRSPPSVSPGNPTIMSVEMASPGISRRRSVNELQIPLAGVATTHRVQDPRSNRTAPAGAGAGRPSAGPGWPR